MESDELKAVLAARQAGASTTDQLLVASIIERSKKSKTAVFLWWFFLGGLGAHRFYLGQVGIGILCIVFWVIAWFLIAASGGAWLIIGIPWALVDLFLAFGKADALNNATVAQMAAIAARPQQTPA